MKSLYRYKQSGDIFAIEIDETVIQWTCSTCGDEGQITGWEDTVWDKRRKSQ